MKKIFLIISAIFIIHFLLLRVDPAMAGGTFHCSWFSARNECSGTMIGNCTSGYAPSLDLCRGLKSPSECNNTVFDCVFTGKIVPYSEITGFEGFRKIFGETRDITLGIIISKLLPYIFIVAGLILFVLLISGGYQFLTSAGSPETVKKAQDKITNALVGFLLIFVAYWLTQVIEVVLGITIF